MRWHLPNCPSNHRHAAARALRTALLAAFLAAAFTAAAPAQSPELRAMWASRFEWPDANPTACRANIDQIMNDLAAANFNAVYFQIRGQADVLYPSPEEVWSPLIGGTDPGWDPLAYAIAAAHARGLEFHAYINTHTCWHSGAHALPGNLDHVFYDHCDAADPARRDWLHHNVPNDPVQFSESSYVWFAPGVPDYQTYTRRQVLYVVRNYDVDGVHFDRIRTPWSYQPSYDPISLARFAVPQTNPDNLDFADWTADQITRTVRDIYAEIAAVKPDVVVSAAVYSNPETAPDAQHQDALGWVRAGALDVAVPMMYYAGGLDSRWDRTLQQWIAGAAPRHVVAGHITSQGVASLLEQINLTRLRGGEGNSVFSWSSFSWWNDYRNSVYASPASTPDLPWKTNPATGVLYGYVTGANGAPLPDIQVTGPVDDYTALSCADGFYAFLLVTPGVHDVTAYHPGYGSVTVTDVAVAAGDVIRRDVALGPPLPPVIEEVQPDPDIVIAGHAYTRQLVLAQGVAESWTLLDGPSGATVDDHGYVFGWTPAPADAGQTFALHVRATNPAGSDDETWSVQVAAAPPCERVRISDFEGYDVGQAVLFRAPRYSGSTVNDLLESPNDAFVTDVAGHSPTQSLVAQWQFVDTDPQRWMRLTTNNGPELPNPTIPLDRPIRVRLQVVGGPLRVALGIRETGTEASWGEDGGTSGTIEWVGAAGDLDGAPQGVLVEPTPAGWQTLLFDPLTDPVHAMTGNGVLWTPTNQGVFEHLAFSIVDNAGPFTVYIDDLDILCGLPAYGDFDGDADVDALDFAALASVLAGPDVTTPPPGSDPQLFAQADSDGDGDVDLAEAAAMQREFTGGE